MRWYVRFGLSYRDVEEVLAERGIDVDHVTLHVLVGADVVMMTSALLRHGPRHLSRVQAELVNWLAEHEYTSVAQLRGSVSHRGAADPTGFERANYLRTLASYRPTPTV